MNEQVKVGGDIHSGGGYSSSTQERYEAAVRAREEAQTLKESNNLTTIVLHRDDLHTITKWIEKFPQSDYVTIEVDNTNPDGSTVTAKIFAQIHGDHVHLIKTIVDESGF
jgi:hypothetical protein